MTGQRIALAAIFVVMLVIWVILEANVLEVAITFLSP
jgi:hypothetical protein